MTGSIARWVPWRGYAAIAALVLPVFALLLPPVAARPVGSEQIPAVVAAVLGDPVVEAVPALLPVAKLLLIGVTCVGLLGRRPVAARVVLGYYAAILVVVAALQNLAVLDAHGLTWLVGNALVQVAVAVVCAAAAGRPSDGGPATVLWQRTWVVPLMLLAIAFPFTIDPAGNAVPGWTGVLLNGAGLTYCMITPVIVGVMLLRPDDYPVRARWLAAYVGLLFGLVNAVTWFGLRPGSWWMGILHAPLLIISAFALWTTRSE